MTTRGEPPQNDKGTHAPIRGRNWRDAEDSNLATATDPMHKIRAACAVLATRPGWSIPDPHFARSRCGGMPTKPRPVARYRSRALAAT
jgi:hypothetical protein